MKQTSLDRFFMNPKKKVEPTKVQVLKDDPVSKNNEQNDEEQIMASE
jgi:hypothetical protein